MLKPTNVFRTAIVLLLAFSSRAFAYQQAAPNPAIQRLIAAIDSNSLKNLETELNQQCLTAISGPKITNYQQVLTMSACREFAHYFGAMPAPSIIQKETMIWLASQPHLMPTLMSAVSAKDPPDKVLEILSQLRSRPQPERLDAYPDLTTALAVVWDKPFQKDETRESLNFPRDRVPFLFDYFTNPRNRLRFDPRSLPWQLEVYLADIKVSPDEMTWAGNKYANNFSLADAYFDVTYDDAAFFNGDDKKIKSHDYTLQNLLQYGGVCVEQAYYASQVSKSLGTPACMCLSNGGGSGDVGHAWIGILTQMNGKTQWDFTHGRYPEDLFWSADITDPQTDEVLTDADVGLLAELQNVKPAIRQNSTLEIKLAELLPPPRQIDVYLREIENCPGNRSAWVALSDLGVKHALSPAQTDAFGKDIDRILLHQYPDFACQILVHFVSGDPPANQISRLDGIANEFPQRPDLKAHIRLVQADILIAEKQNDQAMRTLGDVLTNDLNTGPLIVQAMQRVDKLLRSQNDLIRLANVYGDVWRKIPAPQRSSFDYVRGTPMFVIGKKYLKLLEKLKREAEATAVKQKLLNILPPGSEIK